MLPSGGMSDEQPGARIRLAHAARRLPAQHQYLDALVATTRRALERSTPAEAREALHAFRGALEAHFALEEQVLFPALHGLAPERERTIEALMLEHRAMRDRLAELEEQVGREPRDAVVRAFVDLCAFLRNHERVEERLFASDAGAPESPPGSHP